MRFQLPAILFLATSTVACVDDSTTDGTDTTSVESAIEKPNGGETPTDELPMFDQGPLFEAARIELDTPVDDALASDPAVTAIENAVNGARYRVALVWGQLPPDRTQTVARDWSGSFTLNRGAMVIGRKIGFEPDTDQLLPRTSPDRIDFESITRPFADGLALRVLDPDTTAGPLSLTYTSVDQSVSHNLDLSQLVTAPLVVDAGDGNKIVAMALRERPDCDHGFLRGRWHALREGLGAYRGVVANEAGEVTGHIRGIWGVRQNGDRVMFGKFIANDGAFRGLVVGTYEAGRFRARWITADGDRGVLGGHYRQAADLAGGAFIGRWAEAACLPAQ